MSDTFPSPSGEPGPYAPPQYGAPQYPSPAPPPTGQPYGAWGPAAPARNGLGTAALVLGILAILTGWFFVGALMGVVAIVLGALGRGRAKRGEATNGGTALAGLICGVVGVVEALVMVVVAVLVLNSDSGQRFKDCVDQAVTEEQVDACSERFAEDLTR